MQTRKQPFSIEELSEPSFTPTFVSSVKIFPLGLDSRLKSFAIFVGWLYIVKIKRSLKDNFSLILRRYITRGWLLNHSPL